MSVLDRLYKLHRIFSEARVPRPLSSLARELECALPTAKRLIRQMREHYDAPIEYDRDAGGYHYRRDGKRFELPGLWFSQGELQALLLAEHLFAQAAGGLYDAELAALGRRIRRLLTRVAPGHEPGQWLQLKAQSSRSIDPALFRAVGDGLLAGQDLGFRYRGRGNDSDRRRKVSPERLIHYRDNWYLLAFCLEARAWRSFSLDRIGTPVRTLGPRTPPDTPPPALDGYGLLDGGPAQTVTLRFEATRARWIGDERWHPEQTTRWLPDGRLELRFPAGDLRELVLDVLRYGDEVEVLEPAELRAMVVDKLARAMQRCGQRP